MDMTPLDQILAPHLLLGEIATVLAADDHIVRKAMRVLDSTTRATGASECSLWLATGSELVVAARAGTTATPAAELDPLFEAGDATSGPLVVRALISQGRRLGALVLRVDTGIVPEVAAIASTISTLLASALAWAEQERAWVAEVDRRTRLVEDERRYIHKVVDSLPVSLYVVDREYRITVWNRTREGGSQGVSREQALGKTLFEILHRAPAEKLRQELDEVFRTGRIQQFNMETRATGEPRTYRISKIPMRIVDGEPISHVITIGEDITDVAAAQDRFAQSERLAAMGQLAAGVMHEVNNPLATIGACAESLSLRLESMRGDGVHVADDTTEVVRVIASEVDRCKSIVGGLLDFSRPAPVVRDAVHVNQVVEQALSLLKHQPAFKRLSLQAFLDPATPVVHGSGEQLLQVMLALLQNAADAMDIDGSITVRSRPGVSDAEATIIEVIDEGRGISRADLPHIFEPFYSTKGPDRGTGLGLSICYSIISSHGGRMEVDSAVGAGSTFRILLPGAASL